MNIDKDGASSVGDGVNAGGQGSPPSDSNKKIENVIPDHLLNSIFSFLDESSMEKATILSKNIKSIAITSAKDQSLLSAEQSVKLLKESINSQSYPNQIDTLNRVMSRIIDAKKNFTPRNLLEVEELTIPINNEIIKTLNCMNELQLIDLNTKLKYINIPILLTKTSFLLKIYEDLNTANAQPDDILRSRVLNDIAKSYALTDCVIKLLAIENIDQARIVTDTIPDGDIKKETLKLIVKKLLELSDIAGAKGVANAMPGNTVKNQALALIVKKLLELSDVEGAIEVAGTIAENFTRNRVLLTIVNKLIEIHDLAGAVEVARGMSDDDGNKSEALEQITGKLIELHDFTQAVLVADMIPDELSKSNILKQMVEKLLEIPDLAEAREVAGTIPDDFRKSEALQQIVVKLIELNDFAGAREVADTIPEWLVQLGALEDIKVAEIRFIT